MNIFIQFTVNKFILLTKFCFILISLLIVHAKHKSSVSGTILNG